MRPLQPRDHFFARHPLLGVALGFAMLPFLAANLMWFAFWAWLAEASEE